MQFLQCILQMQCSNSVVLKMADGFCDSHHNLFSPDPIRHSLILPFLERL